MSNKKSSLFDSIFSDDKTISIKVNGHKMRVTYKRSFFSLDKMRELGREEAELKSMHEEGTVEHSEAMADAMLDRLEAILVDWDITDPDGNPVEPTRDVFGKMSIGVINQLWEQIAEDGNPKSPTR